MFKRTTVKGNEEFLSTLEDFILGEEVRINHLSPAELFSLRYEFPDQSATTKKTAFERISLANVFWQLANFSEECRWMIHQTHGLLAVDHNSNCYVSATGEKTFRFEDLATNLDQRMTFFLGYYDLIKGEDFFVIEEILVYIPSFTDTTIYLFSDDLDNPDLNGIFKQNTKFFAELYQGEGKVKQLADLKLDAEWFALTDMKIGTATIMCRYVP